MCSTVLSAESRVGQLPIPGACSFPGQEMPEKGRMCETQTPAKVAVSTEELTARVLFTQAGTTSKCQNVNRRQSFQNKTSRASREIWPLPPVGQ